ncbi:hypothetical protein QJS04_geneDACA021559 [Acorus gramineus]|uniref:Uncharacterized protein n=1 Tax=Acorus gramineus TaxID=55184 RepID=A0AAV9B3N4_ACOGR|nr:hypothetical protein QJS04_geneDACA021559 [Acorus gramineus]
MLGLGFQRLLRSSQSKLFVSSFSVLFTHLALSMVPRLFASLSLLSMLPISGLALLGTLVFGRFFRRVVGVSASAPAFVLFNIIFVWGVYVSVIRKVMTCTMDVIFYVECVLLLIGFDSVLSSDPGMVSCTSSHSGNMDQSAVSEVVKTLSLPSDVLYSEINESGDWNEGYSLWRLGCEYNAFFPSASTMAGEHFPEVRFWNPYDKGIVGNIKEFLKPVG